MPSWTAWIDLFILNIWKTRNTQRKHSVVQLSNKCGRGRIILRNLSKTNVKLNFSNVFDRFLKNGYFFWKLAWQLHYTILCWTLWYGNWLTRRKSNSAKVELVNTNQSYLMSRWGIDKCTGAGQWSLVSGKRRDAKYITLCLWSVVTAFARTAKYCTILHYVCGQWWLTLHVLQNTTLYYIMFVVSSDWLCTSCKTL